MQNSLQKSSKPAEILHSLYRLEGSTEQIIAALPTLTDDQLVEVKMQAKVLSRCAWRIECAAEAEMLRRAARRQNGGRGKRDEAGTGVDATVRHIAAELGTHPRTVYKGAAIHRTFFDKTSGS